MQITGTEISSRPLDGLRTKLYSKFPEAHLGVQNRFSQGSRWKSGLTSIDALFPGGGIPYGQLIEVTGGMSSGKTSLMMRMLSRESQSGGVVYVDLSNMFYPDAAAASGIDLRYLLVVKPKNLSESVRTTELLLKHRVAGCIVVDLVGHRGSIAVPAFHRLRTLVVRTSATLFFLTEDNSSVIPPSMISIRLEVTRKDARSVLVVVSRSRISAEGMHTEVPLYES